MIASSKLTLYNRSLKTLVLIVCITCASLFDFNAESVARSQVAADSRPTTLPEQFTLYYLVTQSDVRSKTLKQSLSDVERNDAEDLRKNGGDKSRVQQMAKLSDDYTQTIPTQTYSVILSGSGERILLHEKKGTQDSVYLYDGSRSAEIEFGRVEMGGISHKFRNVTSMPGYLALVQDTVLPFPGLGFEDIPLLKDAQIKISLPSSLSLVGQSPVIHRGGNGTVTYQPSFVEIRLGEKSEPEVTSCIIDSPYGTEQRWDYQKYTKLGNAWIASKIVFTDYQGYGDLRGNPVRGPSTTYTFELAKSSTQSESKDFFNLKNWLHSNDNVAFVHNGSGRMYFPYRTKGGTLEEQAKHAEYEMQHQQSQSDAGKGSSFAGGALILTCIVCVCAGWIVSRRRTKT